jgi:capsular polysaccharide biosynthesis protein
LNTVPVAGSNLHVPTNANPTRLGVALLYGGGLLLLGSGLWVGFQSRYQATATIEIAGNPWREKVMPKAIQGGCHAIDSSLAAIVESLNLAAEWGMHDSGKATERLRRITDIHPVVSTSLIEIRVASRNPVEAARLANKIAEKNQSPPRVRIVDSATTPTRRVRPGFVNGLKLLALGTMLLAAGLFIRWTNRTSDLD